MKTLLVVIRKLRVPHGYLVVIAKGSIAPTYALRISTFIHRKYRCVLVIYGSHTNSYRKFQVIIIMRGRETEYSHPPYKIDCQPVSFPLGTL